jgi:Polyketide cyclase / dehydrase and lipid transport
MASIHKIIDVGAAPAAAWDALADFVPVDKRVAPGFVTESVPLDGGDRVVTFFNGARARERLVTCDAERRRLVYSVVDSATGFTHHQATVEVHDPEPGGRGARIVWTTDLLPDDLAPTIEAMMERGRSAIAEGLAG